MQQAMAQRQQSRRPSLSTTARNPRFAASLRGLHANLAYLSCSTPDCSQLQSVRRALAGAHRHSRSARAHRAHATRMGCAPRLAYVLDMPVVTDGVHIPLRRRGSRESPTKTSLWVGISRCQGDFSSSAPGGFAGTFIETNLINQTTGRSSLELSRPGLWTAA